MSKVLIYSQEDLDLILELEKEKNEQLQQENKQLKMINKEYERLNKEKFRGFKIINVQEYSIDELLSYKKYKDNWNKLKEYVTNEPILDFYNDKLPFEIIIKKIKDKMQELERGCDSNE